jgi:hypothetical protein
LLQMKEFLTTYIDIVQSNHDRFFCSSTIQVYSEFRRQFLEMTVDKLLEQFVLNKYTGLEKPGRWMLHIMLFKYIFGRIIENFLIDGFVIQCLKGFV